jgi:uncharacterized protein YbjT (DUF2867 family)
MSDVAVIGGTGFLGRAITERLDADTVGRSNSADVQANILLHEELGALKQYETVVNCVGLSPLREPDVPYQAVHAHGVKNILHVLDNDQRLVHISAVGADPDLNIAYLRTKGVGERIIREDPGEHCIIRPGVLYDAESEAWRERVLEPLLFGVMPDVKKKSNPVHRGDVASAVEHVVKNRLTGTLEVYGDETVTVTDMVRRLKPRVFAIPEPIWYPFFFLACEGRLFGLSRGQRLLYNHDVVLGDRPDWFEPRGLPSETS